MWYVHTEKSIRRSLLAMDNEIMREQFLFGYLYVLQTWTVKR